MTKLSTPTVFAALAAVRTMRSRVVQRRNIILLAQADQELSALLAEHTGRPTPPYDAEKIEEMH